MIAMGLPYVFIVVAIMMGVFFYRLAEFEQRPGCLWAASSVAVAFLAYWLLGWGYVGLFCSQVLLFGVMFIDNVIHGRRIE